MTRYTKEDGLKFLEEEAKRSDEEAAAYYAWKRGETPLGSSPTYTPPSTSASPSETSHSSASSVSSQLGEFEPIPNEPSTFETPSSTSTRDSPASPSKHLFDDVFFKDQLTSSSASHKRDHNQERDFIEKEDLKTAEKVNIDDVDLDDQSPEGREKRMRAMADELDGFSASQRKEADEREERKAQEWRSKGRAAMDHFGQRFEE